MVQQALGMIETKGLVGAIEAADSAVKAAAVKLIGYKIVTGGLVMIAVTGEVAAVQAAVDAGSTAAARVGEVISQHVIPRPQVEFRMVINPDMPDHDPSLPEPGLKKDVPKPDKSGGEGERIISSENPTTRIYKDSYLKDLQKMAVGALRELARKTPGIAIRGRQISKANKEQLIREILKAKEEKKD